MRIAHEIVEKNAGRPVALVGIHRRGAHPRHAACTSSSATCWTHEVPLGDIDIAFYRDDVARAPTTPVVHATHLTSALEDHTVVLVDDVLYTGRTVRAGDRGAVRLRAPRAASSSPCWPTAATASCRSAPTTSARTCRPPAASASTSASRELDGVDEVTITELEEAFG